MTKEIPKTIENAVPLLVHFQISEALHSVLNDILPNKVLEYDMKKLKEITEFNQTYAQTDANLKALSSRLRLASKYFMRQEKGIVPFVYGKDYRPDMLHDQATQLSQIDRISLSN